MRSNKGLIVKVADEVGEPATDTSKDFLEKLVVYPNSIMFIFTLCLLVFICNISTVIVFVLTFIPNSSIEYNVFATIISVILFIFGSYEIIQILKKSRVIFYENKFITFKRSPWDFPAIIKDCREIISCDLKLKTFVPCLEFTFTNNKKRLLNFTQFSKRQIFKILKEIKKRGGLPNQEVKLTDPIFKKKIYRPK
jgi:hypothetical protein